MGGRLDSLVRELWRLTPLYVHVPNPISPRSPRPRTYRILYLSGLRFCAFGLFHEWSEQNADKAITLR